MKTIHLTFSLFLLMTTMNAFGQLLPEEPLNVVFEPQTIRKLGIRSVVVFAESSEENLLESTDSYGKVLEAAFDSEGMMTYRLRASNGGNGYEMYYDKGSKIEHFTYDAAGRKERVFRETRKESEEILLRYDESGNIAEVIEIQDRDTIGHIVYQWSNGKMIHGTMLGKSTENRTIRFNEEGRVILNINGTNKDVTTFQRKGDTLIATMKSYESDELFFTYSYGILVSSNRFLFSRFENEKSPIQVQQKTFEYDGHGNVWKYSTNIETEDPEMPMNPVFYRIDNVYNEAGLIVRRNYYRESDGKQTLQKIERYIYETTPLTKMLPEGFFDELRDNENYYDSFDEEPVEAEDGE